jgi:hypothetical protein
MGYTTNSGMVRVDRFKPGGKWYDTWEVDMSAYYNEDAGKSLTEPHETLPPAWLAVQKAVIDAIRQQRVKDTKPPREMKDWQPELQRLHREAIETFGRWTWVCIDPYHHYGHPIMFLARKVDE